MTSATPDESLGQEEVGRGPGARLRDAREAIGLSLEDVSARLHLDRHTVESLEADRFDHLPAPTFVRGYLRAYARLIDLPHAPIIEAFDRRGLEPPALIADIATGQEARSTDLPMRVATYGIVAVLVVLAVVWWQNQRIDEGIDPLSSIPTQPSSDAVAPDGAIDITAPVDEQAAASTPTSEFRFPAPDESNGVPTSLGPVPEPGSTSPPPAIPPSSNPATQPATLTPPPPPTATNTQVVAPAPVAESEQPAATQTQPPTEASDAARVVLRFKADSWVEIHDADDKRLYFNLAKAGRSVDVSGTAPIKVLIGYIEGVEMEYNGRPYDFSKYVRKGVARFEVGAN